MPLQCSTWGWAPPAPTRVACTTLLPVPTTLGPSTASGRAISSVAEASQRLLCHPHLQEEPSNWSFPLPGVAQQGQHEEKESLLKAKGAEWHQTSCSCIRNCPTGSYTLAGAQARGAVCSPCHQLWLLLLPLPLPLLCHSRQVGSCPTA